MCRDSKQAWSGRRQGVSSLRWLSRESRVMQAGDRKGSYEIMNTWLQARWAERERKLPLALSELCMWNWCG